MKNILIVLIKIIIVYKTFSNLKSKNEKIISFYNNEKRKLDPRI